MLRNIIACVLHLFVAFMLVGQVTPEGNMLVLEYKGLLIVVGVALVCAIMNVLFLVGFDCMDVEDF